MGLGSVPNDSWVGAVGCGISCRGASEQSSHDEDWLRSSDLILHIWLKASCVMGWCAPPQAGWGLSALVLTRVAAANAVRSSFCAAAAAAASSTSLSFSFASVDDTATPSLHPREPAITSPHEMSGLFEI
jgi:hypothetical protein